MTHRILFLISLFASLTAHAGMVRVASVADGRTLVLEGSGQHIRLAGIEITDEVRARDLLQWTVVSRWVRLEKNEAGEHLVWRSPDALFINRELVTRGYANPTQPGIALETHLEVTYLGQVDPAGRQSAVSGGGRSGTGKRTGRHSPARSSRPRKSSRPATPGKKSRVGPSGPTSGS